MSFVSAAARLAVVLVALVGLVPTPATYAAADAPAPVEPSIKGMSAELLSVQRSLQNARIKLERGIVAGTGTVGTEQLDTPASRCCSTNMKQIDAALRRVLVHIDGLARRAAAAEDEIALGQLELIHDGVMGLGRGLQAFAGSTEQRRAQAALDGMIRPFNMATSATRGLSTCCADRLESSTSPAPAD